MIRNFHETHEKYVYKQYCSSRAQDSDASKTQVR